MVKFSFICAVTTASVGSGFQHGYNIGVLNAPQEVMEQWILNTEQVSKKNLTLFWSSLVSIYCIGGMIGGGLSALISNKLGRKGGLILNNILAIIGGIVLLLTKWTEISYLLIIGRVIVGINSGLNAALGPTYLSEVAPVKIRGSIGSLYQLVITITILLAQLLGVKDALGSEQLWPTLFIPILIAGVYQILGFLFAPESPKYFLYNDKDEKAEKAISKLVASEDIVETLQSMKKEVEESKSQPKVTISDLFKIEKLRKPLIIICILMFAQQFSGINAVIFYSTKIFKEAKLNEITSQYATVGMGLVNVLTTILSLWLVEVSGRKILLLIGFFGMCISSILLCICLYFVNQVWISYLCIILVYVYVIFFATGCGSIPWLLGPELFSTAARPAAISLAVPSNWLANFVIGILFLPLQKLMGPAVFIIFIVCQILSFFYVLIVVPETKGKAIEEIVALFEK